MKTENHLSRLISSLSVIAFLLITNYSSAQQVNIDTSYTHINWVDYKFAGPHSKLVSDGWWKWWYASVAAVPLTVVIYVTQDKDEDEVISPPIISCPPDQTLSWNQTLPPPNPASVTATNNCPDGELTIQHIGDVSNGGNGCAGDRLIIVRTYNATDACGNQSSCTQTFTFAIDEEAPTLSCPTDMTLQWGDEVPDPDINLLTASDNCTPTGDIILSHLNDEDNAGSGCAGDPRIVTRTYQAEDACGNQSSCTQTFTFAIDEEAPTLNCPTDMTLQWGDEVPAPDINLLTASDNCTPTGDIILSHLNDEDNAGSGCAGDPRIVTRTYQAQDACGNQSSCTQTFTFAVDEEAPTLSCPTDMTLQWGDEVPDPDINLLTASDNCTPTGDIILTHLNDEDNAGSGCAGDPRIVTRTYQAQDACGNQSSCTQTFTFAIDEEAPTLSCPTDMTLQWGDEVPAPDINLLTASDNCTPTGDIILTHLNDEDNAGSGCAGDPRIVTRTYQAQDACGNQSSCTQTFTFAIDEEAPTLNCPTDMTLQWGDEVPDPDINLLTASDNCTPTGDIILTHLNDEDNAGSGCAGDPRIVTRTYQAQDACGNQSSCTQTFTFAIDEEAPAISCPDEMTLQWGDEVPDPDINLLTASDNCTPTGDIILSHLNDEDNAGSGCAGDPRIVTRTYQAEDACGNQSTCTQTFTFAIDEEAPSLSCPTDMTLQWGDEVPDPDINLLTASDNCTPTGDIILSHLNDEDNAGSGCAGDPRVVTRTYQAEDACGNQSTCTQTFTFAIDEEAPSLSCPTDMTLQWGDEVPDPDINLLTASDNCTPTGDIILSHLNDEDNAGSGCAGDPRVVTRTYQAEDACGNQSTCTQTFTFAIDEEAPTLNCPTDMTLQWGDEVPDPDINLLTASDNCTPTGDIILSHLNDEDNAGSGCAGDPRVVTRTYQAEDACGNQSTCTQTFTFAIDEEAPAISCPDEMTLQWGDEVPDPDINLLTASDNCTPTGDIILSHLNDEDNAGSGCAGDPRIVTRTYQAQDACGNQSICTQTFTFAIDEEAPAISCPDEMTLQWGDEVPDPDINLLTASDNCTPTGDIILSHLNDEDNAGSGCAGDPRVVTRTYQAQDACGNQSSCTQTFTFAVDEEAPTVFCPANITLQCTEDIDPSNIGEANATDNCTPDSEITINYQDDLSGLTECNGTGTIIRTWTATDNCGNVSTCIQMITIEDTTTPVFTDIPTDVTVDCNNVPPAYDVVTTDNCMTSNSPSITYEETIGTGCPYDIIRTWVATDDCGNASTFVQTITVEDNTAPVISCPADVIVICGESTDPSITGTPLTTDCTATNFAYTDDFSNQTGCTGFIIRTFVVVDLCGNTSICQHNINIVDTGCDFMPDISVTDAECAFPSGEIAIVPITDFTYNWSNGAAGPVISNLTSGSYTVTIVNDDLSCSQIVPVTVPQAPPYELIVATINHPSSSGASDGSIELVVPGPNTFPPFTILLNGSNYGTTSSTTFTIDNLSQGTYVIQLIDMNGCLSETVTVLLVDIPGFGNKGPGDLLFINLNPTGLSQTDWNKQHKNAYDPEQVFENLSSIIEHPPTEGSYEINYLPLHSYMVSGGKYLNPNLLLGIGVGQFSGKAYSALNDEVVNPFYLESRFQGLQIIGGMRSYFGNQKFRLIVGADASWKNLSIGNSILIFDQNHNTISDATSTNYFDFNITSGLQLPMGEYIDIEFEFRPGLELAPNFRRWHYFSTEDNIQLNLRAWF